MHIEDLETIINRLPFRPFRMMLTTHQTVDVMHSDMIFTNPRFIAVGIRKPDSLPEEDLLMHWIDVSHVVYICQL